MGSVLPFPKDALSALCRRNGIRRLSLFGSRLNGDFRPDSDVDLLVEPEPGQSGFALGALLMGAEELLGRHVDVVTVGALHPLLRGRVLSEAQAL